MGQRQAWSTVLGSPVQEGSTEERMPQPGFGGRVDTVNADGRQPMKRKYMQARTCEMMGIHQEILTEHLLLPGPVLSPEKKGLKCSPHLNKLTVHYSDDCAARWQCY